MNYGEIFLSSWMTLTFQGHDPVKSSFGPYLISCWTNCHQILTQRTLGRGLSINSSTARSSTKTSTKHQRHAPVEEKKTALYQEDVPSKISYMRQK